MTQISPPKDTWQMKVFPLLIVLGWVLVMASFLIGLFVLAPTSSAYWGGNTKALRDVAEVGSPLLGQLGTLATTPRWLVPLTFLGVASFMTGIALAFSTIPSLLNNRGEVLAACFPIIAKSGS